MPEISNDQINSLVAELVALDEITIQNSQHVGEALEILEDVADDEEALTLD